MKVYEISCNINSKWLWLLKLISRDFLFFIDTDLQDEIENLIEESNFDKAEELISEWINKYDESNFTVKLSTRISTIKILGDRE